MLAFGIGQGGTNAVYFLIHIVESASAVFGTDSNDLETIKDQQQLQLYAEQLARQGLNATAILGYRDRSAEIIRIVKETQADLLLLGAHRHTGLKDIVYGETVNSVRHGINVPVLIVNV